MTTKYKRLILSIFLSLWIGLGWTQTAQKINALTPTNKVSKLQTDSTTVTDSLYYDRAAQLIEWLNKSIVLNQKQKKMIETKGKKVKENYKNYRGKSEEITKQLQSEYKLALDSILTSEQKKQLAPQFN